MRLVSFHSLQGVRLGAAHEGSIIDLNLGWAELLQQRGLDEGFAQAQANQELPAEMVAFLTRGQSALDRAADVIAAVAAGHSSAQGVVQAADGVQLAAPVPTPTKVICVGQNYRDHCAEQGVPIPDEPVLFSKYTTAVIGPGASILLPEVSQKVDYEAELAFVIGKTAKHARREDGYSYVAGYMVAHDVSARDIQMGAGQNKQWMRGKSPDTFAPLGPYLVTRDEIPDPPTLGIRLILNGQVMQDSNTSNLIYNVLFLIEFITQSMTLVPGDVILTGTPPGVGHFRTPPIYLKPGDTVSVEIDGLGTLTNPVASDDGQPVR